MHVISLRRLREFWEIHPQAESPLRAWFTRIAQGHWENFAELKQEFPTADLVSRLTVFNISGNRYRLIARIEFEKQRVYIRAVLTHRTYNEEKWKDDDWFS